MRITDRARSFGLLVFAVALVIAVTYNIVVWDSQGPREGTDASEYDSIARSVASGHGFLGAKRPPLFTALLAIVFVLFGHNYLVVRIVLSALAAGTCALIYFLARETTGNERTARWAGGLACIYPPLFVWAGRLFSEVLFTFLITAFALFLARSGRGGRTPLLAGVFLGMAMLARAAATFFVLLVPCWVLATGRGESLRRRAMRTAAILLPAVLVVAPWTIRNYRVTGHFVPVSTGGGIVLIGSNNPVTVSGIGVFPPGIEPGRGVWVFPRDSQLLTPDEIASAQAMGEVERDRFYRHRAWEYVRGHPRQMLTLVAFKLFKLFEIIPPHGGWRKSVVLLPYYAVLLLAIAGCVIARHRWRALLPLLLVVLATLAQVILTWGTRRFRHPMEPVLVVLAGVALERLEGIIRAKRDRAVRHRAGDESGPRPP